MQDGDCDSWEKDFPRRDEVEDFAGERRVFLITCTERAFGFILDAREDVGERIGYKFSAFSETSPYAALGDLRLKMRRALATRHLTRSDLGYGMLHDELRGRIEWDSEDGTVLVVDGIPLPMESLDRILASHEGWNFELKIVDATE